MLAFLVAFPTWIYLWKQTADIERYSATANMSLALLTPNLDPLEAIDLAYTLEMNSPGGYIVPLAQAK